MAVLAGNMSLVSTLSGLIVMLIGLYDLFQLKIDSLCRSMQYVGFGFGIGIKVAHVCMAVDQFIAVVQPLHHFTLMMQARPWLFAATWLIWAVHVLFGATVHLLGLETFAESLSLDGGNVTLLFPECRWESSLANVYWIVYEVEVTLFSLLTAGMFVYTGVIGHRTKRALMQARRQQNGDATNDDGQKFFENYRAFKRILLVLSLTICVDIVGPVVRLVSRWFPMPKLNGLLHQLRLFAFIFEGWSYGLLNSKLSAAYKKTLCGRCRGDTDFGITSIRVQLSKICEKRSDNRVCPIDIAVEA